MKKNRLLIGALGLMAMVSCAGERRGPTTCVEILAARCVGCHDKDRVCERLSRKSRGRWEATLDRMIRRGAELDVEQKTTLADCLDRPGDDLRSYCQ